MRTIRVIILILLVSISPSIGWSYQITGTFIQLFKNINYPRPPIDWNAKDWLEEIRYMKEVKIDTLIIQYAIYDNDAYYPSKYGKMITRTDQIENILSACQKEKLSVYLGLTLDSKWWKGVSEIKFLNQLKERSIAVAKELLSKYGRYKCIKGWYLPFEIEDRAWINPEREDVLTKFLKDTVKGLKNLTPKFPIIISPYFLGIIPPKELAPRWAKLFKLAGIDMVAIQDGSGRMNYKISNEKTHEYFRAFKEELRKDNIELWVDMEIYHQTKDWPNWDAEPTSIESIKERLEVEGPLVEKIVSFEFTHYMSPRMGKKQEKLYQDYRRLK
ncbi:MAG: DUF4434 domain-containing protein [bacterium]